MKVLYNWLKEFVDLAATPDELRGRLAMCGVPVEALEQSAAGPALDLEIFSNRGDLLGHFGVAREIAAAFRTRVKPPSAKPKESPAKAADAVRVTIACPDLCGRFTARVICGVRIQPSPPQLRERLEALGVASINNVVDATNYVMLELGHPLHAFDYDLVRDHAIIVRRAKPGDARGAGALTKMRTLDGIERALPPDACMVCDGDGTRAVGIGGIMGGAETEISLSTKNVLLECAWFDPISIRRTAKALGLRTEASIRFERGADPELAELASRRCAELIQQLAGGEVLAGVVDAYPGRRAPRKIALTRAEILRVMGADIPDKEIEAILAALGFAPARVDANRGSAGSLLAAWECAQPSWRADVEREIDLVEEVARHFGFDKFPARLPAARQPAVRLPQAEAEERLRERLVGLGYREILTITHVDEGRDALFRPEDVAPARIANPIAEDAGILRTNGLVTMAGALEWNLNHGQRNLRLFEVGRRYAMKGSEPVETPILTIGAAGEAREKSVHEDAREYGFADLKGDIDAIGELTGGFRWEFGGAAWLHPAHCGRIFLGNEEIGVAGQLGRRVNERLKLRHEAFLAELRLDPIFAAYRARKDAPRYEPLPRFPAVERDFSLLLADGTTFAQVADAMRATGIAEIVSIEAVDLFRGKNVPAGKYSLLVRVTFQSREATLTEQQLTDFSARIVAALKTQLGAQLRAQ
jgi:phenylalanyl-tRNA synthetase beta chain